MKGSVDLSWLPNVFIAGAPKAGTSSLHAWIADHPVAFGSREKETYFFSDPGSHMFRPSANAGLGLASWRDQFPIPASAQPKVIVESTPGYLYSRTALLQIPDLPSQPKCVFVLREPSVQIYSLYSYFRDNWSWVPAEMSFADFLASVRAGNHDFGGNELAQNAISYARYVDHLILWLNALGSDRIMVATFDDLVSHPRAFTKRVAAFVGLDPAFYDNYAFPRENETYSPRNRTIQRVNVALRGFVPRGKIYQRLRKLYRRANTTVPTGPSDADRLTLKLLRKEFAVANTELAETFDLDLSSWRLR